jgi:hypothetical protein
VVFVGKYLQIYLLTCFYQQNVSVLSGAHFYLK